MQTKETKIIHVVTTKSYLVVDGVAISITKNNALDLQDRGVPQSQMTDRQFRMSTSRIKEGGKEQRDYDE